MSWCSFFLNDCTCFVMFVRNMQYVTLSVFIVSQQMFVSVVWAIQLIQDERFIEFGYKRDRICGKVQQNILKERAHILSSLLEYAVVLVYLKMAACALVLPWMGSNPSSNVDGDLKQQGPHCTQTHPMWPRDICQWNGHIFWHSTACKWSQMRRGSPTACFPVLLVLGLWWAWLFWLWFRVFFCMFVCFYLCDKAICDTMGEQRSQWLFVFVSMWICFTIKLSVLSAFYSGATLWDYYAINKYIIYRPQLVLCHWHLSAFLIDPEPLVVLDNK